MLKVSDADAANAKQSNADETQETVAAAVDDPVHVAQQPAVEEQEMESEQPVAEQQEMVATNTDESEVTATESLKHEPVLEPVDQMPQEVEMPKDEVKPETRDEPIDQPPTDASQVVIAHIIL